MPASTVCWPVDALSPEDVLSAYRTLLVVEDVFQVLKDILDMRPLLAQV